MKEVKPNCENGKIKLNNIYNAQDELSAQDLIDDIAFGKKVASKPLIAKSKGKIL